MHTGWDDEQQRKIDTTDELTAENERLQAEVHELFKRNQVLQSQNDKLQQRKQDAVDEAYKLRQIMRKKERYAIDVKIEFDETLQTERAHVAKLQSENAALRAQLAEANKRNSHLERFLSGVEAYHRLGQCSQCGAATFDGLICGVCRHDDSDD